MERLAIVFVGFVIVGCSSEMSYQGSIAISSATAPHDDNQDLFDANVVTNLAALSVQATVFCSGILLTRTRVLTASHCVVGLPNLSVGPSPPVQVGSVSFGTTSGAGLASDTPPVVPISELGHYTDPNNLSDVGADIAIVVLDEVPLDQQIRGMNIQPPPPGAPTYPGESTAYSNGLDATEWGNLLGTNVVRPSLMKPTTDTIGFASWGEASDRQLRMFAASLFALAANSFSIRASGAGPGDSGAPLFSIRADGSRDPFGILSGGDDQGNATFVDLTSAQNSAWIVKELVDRSHDAQPNWQTKHPTLAGRSDWWIGEDEYSGPCKPNVDTDCDHWLDANDNCPLVFNHDQIDTDDDGTGDACGE